MITFTPDRAQLARAIDTLGFRRTFDARVTDPLYFMVETPSSFGQSSSQSLGIEEGDRRGQNEQVILEFGLKKPAFRIVVNTPTTHGSIGLTTGLDPAMTLGCGGWGGNITSDNISPKHLLNIKRVAYEVTVKMLPWPSRPRRGCARNFFPE